MAEELPSVAQGRPKRILTVYKCRNCGTLLGNDDFLVPGAKEAKSIVVSEVENAMMATSLHISTDRQDKGCTYHVLQCKRCQEDIGIHYSAVTKAMDHLKNSYRLQINMIDSIQMTVATNTQAEIDDLKSKVNDLAVMGVEAVLDRCQIKDAIVSLAGLIGSLKQEMDGLKGDTSLDSTS